MRAQKSTWGQSLSLSANGGYVPKTQYGTLFLEYGEDQTQAAQRSKCRTCLGNKYTQFLFKGINWTYTIFVCLLFTAFAINRAHKMDPKDTWTPGKILLAVLYGASSFIMNFPMALLFTKKAIGSLRRLTLGNPKKLNHKKEPLFATSAVMAIFLAIGTTAAGWAVASDIKEDLKIFPFIKLIPGFTYFLALLSLWNTFSTRLDGSVYLIYESLLLPVWSLFNRFGCIGANGGLYRDVLTDLKNHGAEVDGEGITLTEHADHRASLHSFLIKKFYPTMSHKGLRPGFTWTQTAARAFETLMTLAIMSVFMVNMQPLWLKLTVDGLQEVSFLRWANNAYGAWYAATSNELFYLRSAKKFLPTLISFTSVTAPKIKTKFYNANSRCKKFGVVAGSVSFVTAWLLFAYFSGEGYAELGSEAVCKGFGPIPDKTYFSIPVLGAFTKRLFPVYDWVITAFAAGVIVNGGSALRYLQDQYAFFKAGGERSENTFDSKKAIELLETEGPAVLADISDAVCFVRNKAKPIPSFWECCFKFKKDPVDQDLLLAENGGPLLQTTSALTF